VVTTKLGSSKEVLLVCGHFDTRNGPGANDNGSGVAAILETARILKDLNTTRTVLFVHFDGEEEGYIGSSHYVDYQLLAIQDNLYLVFNIDQIGGTYGVTGNDKIVCERDEIMSPSSNNAASARITDSIAQLARLYTSLTPVISNAFLSDYIPFEEKGEVITGLYQNASDKFSHRPSDTLGNMDTTSFKQAVRLAAAGTIYFAQAEKYLSLDEIGQHPVALYPNPVSDYLYIENNDAKSLNVKVYNLLGEVVLTLENPNKVPVLSLDNGLYVVELDLGKSEVYRQKVLVQH
jgi:aminopeptidase YwaD